MKSKRCHRCGQELIYVVDRSKFWCKYCREFTTIIGKNSGPGGNPTIGTLLEEHSKFSLPDTGTPQHLLPLVHNRSNKKLFLQIREENEDKEKS